MPRPSRVYISASSNDLRSAQRLVARILAGAGVEVVSSQGAGPTHGRSMLQVIRDRIASCDAMIHIVGMAYGLVASEDRVGVRSYSQLEYEFAEEVEVPVHVLICGEDFPFDPNEAEPEGMRQKQLVHRDRLQRFSGLHYCVHSQADLQTCVLQIISAIAPANSPEPLAEMSKKPLLSREQLAGLRSAGAIFLSAKSEDYELAQRVYAFLMAEGFSCFFSRESLDEMGEADYKAVIDEALESARHMVVVTSSRTNADSRWVKYEWDTFANEKLSGRKSGNLVAVLCGTMKPADLPIGLRRYQALSLETELGRLPRFLGPKPLAKDTGQNSPVAPRLEVPEYDLVRKVAQGMLCKVWLARNAVGQWQAIKAVFLERFMDRRLYEREFNGIKQYMPLSHQHPGLTRVDFVSRLKDEGYFYYALELADSLTPGWREEPALYRPCDLRGMHTEAPNGRLPLEECAHIGFSIAEALRFLHEHKLTHGDVKPSNVLFVNGRPKLADIGLVTQIGTGDEKPGWIGTGGYLPPLPEPRGTIQSDIYGLGKLMYVISTGRQPDEFPQIDEASWVEDRRYPVWSSIILKACHPERAQRYATTEQLIADLGRFQQEARQDMSGR